MFGKKRQPEPETIPTIAPVEPEEEESSLDCAWCLAEQGIKPSSGSHGICSTHYAQVLAQAEQRQQRRQGQR